MFKYESCLPYELPNQQLRLRSLCEQLKSADLQVYEFGSNFATKAGELLAEILGLHKVKIPFPPDLKRELTILLIENWMKASEPVLMCRYARAVIDLWAHNVEELKQQDEFVEWKQVYICVKNAILNAHKLPLDPRKSDSSPSNVSIQLATVLQYTAKTDTATFDFIFNDLLSFIDSANKRDLPLVLVLEAFTSVIPFGDSKADLLVPTLFELVGLVPSSASTAFLMDPLAEFAMLWCQKGEQSKFSDEQLSRCFQLLLNSLMIPLASQSPNSKTVVSKFLSLNSKAFAKFVVWSSSPQDLRSLIKFKELITAVKSFCHPSNSGSWSVLIYTLFLDVLDAFIWRVFREQELSIQIPLRLNLEMKTELGEMLLDPMLMGLHSQVPLVFDLASKMCQYMSIISPHTVVPKVLSEFYMSVQTGSLHSQRLAASVSGVCMIAEPLVKFEEYKVHLTTLLELCLPMIDVNEPGRCLLTLSVFQHLASLTNFADKSCDKSIELAQRYMPQIVETLTLNLPPTTEPVNVPYDLIIKGTSFAFNDILQQFFSRCLDLLEQNPEPNLAAEVTATIGRVLSACSSDIYTKLVSQLIDSISMGTHSPNSLSRVCGVFVRINCQASFPKLWKVLYEGIQYELQDNLAGKSRVVLPKDEKLLRLLSCLNMCVLSTNSKLVLNVFTDLKNLISMLRECGQGVLYTVANLIHHSIASLANYSVVIPGPHDLPPLDPSLNIQLSDSKEFAWHVPTTESREAATELYTLEVNACAHEINELVNTQTWSLEAKDQLTKYITLLRTSTGAISPLVSTLKVTEMRTQVVNLLLHIFPKIPKDDSSNIKAILFLCKVWLCDYGYERNAKLAADQQSLYYFEKRIYKLPGSRKTNYPNVLKARRAQLYHHQQRVLQTAFREIDPLAYQLLTEVVSKCCFSSYPGVQNNAFSTLNASLKMFKCDELYEFVYKQWLESTTSLFNQPESHLKLEGALHMLKYGSIGKRTIGKFPKLFIQYAQLMLKIANAGLKDSSVRASQVYTSLLSQCLRFGIHEGGNTTEITQMFAADLSQTHWTAGVLNSLTLAAVYVCPSATISSQAIKSMFNGIINPQIVPPIKINCIYGVLSILQRVFRTGLMGYDLTNLQLNGELDVPLNAQTSQTNGIQNDISQFMDLHSSLGSIDRGKPRPFNHVLRPNCQGWLTLPTQGLWQVKPEQLHLNLTAEDVKELAVIKDLNTPQLWTSLYDLWCLEPNQDLQINKQNVLLVRNLAAMIEFNFATADLATFLASLEFIQTPQFVDKNSHRSLAIFTSALLCSLPICNNQVITSNVCKLVEKVVTHLAPENIKYWIASLTFAFAHVDFQRLQPVYNKLILSTQDPSTNGIKLGLRTALLTEVNASLSWRCPPQTLDLALEKWHNWDHDLEIMRSFISEHLSVAFMAALKPQSRKWSDEFIVEVPPSKLQEVAQLFKTKDLKTRLSLLNFMLDIAQYVESNLCFEILVNGGLEFLLECSNNRDDRESLILSTKVFHELGFVSFAEQFIQPYTTLLNEQTQKASWHGRIRLLLLIQQFVFNHLLMIPTSVMTQILGLVKQLLYDQQAEVRELASETLSGIVRCKFSATFIGLNEFITEFENKYNSANFNDRHGAVLGLGSLVAAYPYTSPPPKWMPSLLSMLAVKCTSDLGIIAKSAKNVLSEFKKTRQDTWHIDQISFSQDQLDDLDGVLWRNYFA